MIEKRRKDTHKGDYGHLFILGGSPGLTGAVCLAGISALRSGCGLVTIGIPEGLNDIIEIKLTEVMSLPLPQTKKRTFSEKAVKPALKFIEEKADGVLIGPGISTGIKETSRFVEDIVKEAEKSLIIDADALKIMSSNLDILKKSKSKGIIITPHPGEMSYLTGLKITEIQKYREKVAEEFARKYNVVVVLKGHRTVVADGEHTYINLTGNPGMATAGSGDVLAGIIGGLLIQGYSGFESARYGVYIHGLAGDIAAKKLGEASLIASDIIEKLPIAFGYIDRKV
ncbi:MAG: NAD(P)H-hydrate dehydratase [Candidatus Omnitrophica bacterium]|nr:NAD(P)H-hydrate dehydratase [Candidatus Omnitrophota bacterium]